MTYAQAKKQLNEDGRQFPYLRAPNGQVDQHSYDSAAFALCNGWALVEDPKPDPVARSVENGVPVVTRAKQKKGEAESDTASV